MKRAKPLGFGLLDTLEPRIAPAVDFDVVNVSFTAPDPIAVVPGDKIVVKFTVKNIGTSTGPTVLSGYHIHLSADQLLTLNSVTDPRIGGVESKLFNFSPGEERTFTATCKLPAAQLPTPTTRPDNYYILVEADAGHRVAESNEANNVGNSDNTLSLAFAFGDVGNRSDVRLAVADGNGSGTLSLPGIGRGDLIHDPEAGIAGNFLGIQVGATTAASRLVFAGSGVDFMDLNVPGPLGSAFLPGANFGGDLKFPQGVKLLVAGNIGVVDAPIAQIPKVLNIGGPADGAPVTILLGRVADLDIGSNPGIHLLGVKSWDENIGNDDEVLAPYMGTLSASDLFGDFEANVTLDGGETKAGFTLGGADIKGRLIDSTFKIGGTAGDNIEGNVNVIRAFDAENFALDAEGDVGSLLIRKDLVGVGYNVRAETFGRIEVSGTLSEGITARGTKANGRAIATLGARTVLAANVAALSGGIGTIAVDEWIGGGSIATHWIKNLLVTGDFSDPNVLLQGDFSPDMFLTGLAHIDIPADLRFGLTFAAIRGTITGGTWNLAASAGTIAAGATDTNWVFAGSPIVGAQGTLVIKLATRGTLAGSVSAIAFVEVRAGELAADITATGSFRNFAIGSLYAGVVRDTNPAFRHNVGDVEVRAIDGDIGIIQVGEWEDGVIEAEKINRITATGLRTTVPGPALSGLFGANVTLTPSLTPFGATVLKSLVANGPLDDVAIVSQGSDSNGIGKITAHGWNGGQLDTGFVGTVTIYGDLDAPINLRGSNFNEGYSLEKLIVTGTLRKNVTLAGDASEVFIGRMIGANFTVPIATGTIGTFSITKIAGLDGPFFSASNVQAKQIGNLVIRDVELVAGGPYGIVADKVLKYSRYIGVQKVKFGTNLDDPQSDTAGDFSLQIT